MEEKRQQADLAEPLLDDGSHRVQSMQLCSRVAGKGIIGILSMIQIFASFKYFMGPISSTAPLVMFKRNVSLEGQNCSIWNVSFSMKLDGTVLRGQLFQPNGSSSTNKVPVMVSTNSWGATMNLGGGKHMAGSICDAGFAVMRFDWKSYGYSDGEPRCVANWWEDLDSYRDSLDFLESQEFVDKDRIVVSGDSWGGGLSLTLGAIDPRVKAIIVQTPGLITNISNNSDADAFASYKQTILQRLYHQAPSYAVGPLPLVTSDPNSTNLSWMGSNPVIPVAESQVALEEAAENSMLYFTLEAKMDPSWRNETTYIVLDTPQKGTADIAVHFVYQPVSISCSGEDEVTVYDDCLKLFDVIPSKDKELTHLKGGHDGAHFTDVPRIGDRPDAFYDELNKTLNFLKRIFP